MDIADYVAFAAQRIAEAVGVAWCARRPGAIGYGLGQAVVGHNRRSSYYSGRSQMYGDTSTADFSHMEGYEDHSVNVLATWDTAGWATGSSYCRSAPPPATSRRMSRWTKQPKSVCCVWQGGRSDRKSRSE